MQDSPGIATFLFTDIEGSSRLWEREPERMGAALARHDAIIRGAVERHHGTVVKMLGDGVHAHFDDPLDAINAILEIQLALVDPASTGGFPLKIRSGLHAGAVTRRDHDFFGSAVNRAARIMSSAHGGQVLVSSAVLALVADRLPAEIELRDLGAVRLRDLTSPEHLYQVMHAKLRRDFPALRSLETTPNNLPQQLTSFVGRERELAEVKRALGTTRLLTLIGPGGIGKTRIGLHVAAELMDEHPDGVWFIDLAPLTDAQLVPHALASVLGVVEEAGRPVTEAIVKYLKDRRELILLDNCEHLLHACAELATQILRNAPNVRILASSRELMHVAGETSFPMPTLSVPEAGRVVTPDALPHFEAAQLFIDRATAVKPAFRVTDANAGAIADICRRLDGIPLAIELAAARVRALSVDAIAARLTDRFKLLAGGDQSALPRQQTLRALIDWSYDLLSEPEKALLRRLSVFAGGWTLEAAEEVTAGGIIAREDVLDLQAHLVDKSLVALDADGDRYRMLETVREYAMEKLERGKSESAAKANVAADAGAARYGMLESVRAYAKERLDESGEADEVRDRHLAYYLQYAEDSRSRSRAVMPVDEKGDPLVRFERERENLVVAHAWCDHARQGGPLGLRLAKATLDYCFARGLLAIGHRMATEALRRPGAQQEDEVRARVLFELGQFECYMGLYQEAQRTLSEGLRIYEALGSRKGIGQVLQPLGMAAFGLGDLAAARGYLERACEIARERGDKHELAAALNNLAQVHRLEGNIEHAEPLYVNVVEIARELDDRDVIAVGLLNCSMISLTRDDLGGTRRMLAEVVDIVIARGSRPIGQSALDVSAAMLAAQSLWEAAARLYGAAERQLVECGFKRDAADEAFLQPFVERIRDALGESMFARSSAEGQTIAFEEAIAEAKARLEL
jgi:predicted ATPase/class 3 adenylate cyclase